jgi:hypothetical protein
MNGKQFLPLAYRLCSSSVTERSSASSAVPLPHLVTRHRATLRVHLAHADLRLTFAGSTKGMKMANLVFAKYSFRHLERERVEGGGGSGPAGATARRGGRAAWYVAAVR